MAVPWQVLGKLPRVSHQWQCFGRHANEQRPFLDWREYVRGIYWTQMPGYVERNALDGQRQAVVQRAEAVRRGELGEAQ